jgi:hypothetical protein
MRLIYAELAMRLRAVLDDNAAAAWVTDRSRRASRSQVSS